MRIATRPIGNVDSPSVCFPHKQVRNFVRRIRWLQLATHCQADLRVYAIGGSIENFPNPGTARRPGLFSSRHNEFLLELYLSNVTTWSIIDRHHGVEMKKINESARGKRDAREREREKLNRTIKFPNRPNAFE